MALEDEEVGLLHVVTLILYDPNNHNINTDSTVIYVTEIINVI